MGNQDQSRRIETVGIATASHKPEVDECARHLTRALVALGCEVIVGGESGCPPGARPADCLEELARADLVISLGGDGTLLALAHQAGPHGTPLLGVDLGSFGFLAAESFEIVLARLEEIVAGRFATEPRVMVAAEILREGQVVGEHCGLNEAVIASSDVGHLVRLHTSVDGEPIATYPADGLIISTPTGSTAYGLSAGGPIVSPAVKSLILTPICSHTLYARPLVVEPTATVEVSCTRRGQPTDRVCLTLDGQDLAHLQAGDVVRVRRAPYDAQLVHVAAGSFYERLRTKLHWDADG